MQRVKLFFVMPASYMSVFVSVPVSLFPFKIPANITGNAVGDDPNLDLCQSNERAG